MSAEQSRAARAGHRWPLSALRRWVASWPGRWVRYGGPRSVWIDGWWIVRSSTPVLWAYRYLRGKHR